MTALLPFKSLNERKYNSDAVVILMAYVQQVINKTKKSQYQLTQVFNRTDRYSVKSKASAYLSMQNKLRIKALEILANLKNNTTTDTDPIQERYIGEVDLLINTHFTVAKTYQTFLYKHFDPQVIKLTTMAA